MSRSGLSRYQAGGSRVQRVNTRLPNGSFQSVDASLTAQERCRIPDKNHPVNDDFPEGLGKQDVPQDEPEGVEDVPDDPSVVDKESIGKLPTEDVETIPPNERAKVDTSDSLIQIPINFEQFKNE
jgi:hypothetical protein